jgi:hypothetical protein
MICKEFTMFKFATTIISVISLLGCAAPPEVKLRATQDLRGACLALFLNPNVGGYQYVSNASTGRSAFALASDAGGQSCGMATNMSSDISDSMFLSLPNVDRVEAVAIQRCEANKSPSIKAPCRTYARKNEIVWGSGSGLKGFQ